MAAKSPLFWMLFLLPALAYSQACCSGGTPLSANLGVSGIDAKQLGLQLTYDYNTQRALVNGSQKLDDQRRARNTHVILLRGKYGLGQRLSLIGILSWVRQEEENKSPVGGTSLTSAAGVGDVIALLQYELWAKDNSRLLLAAGAKAPVGKTNVVDPTTEVLLNADLQPGTGSWDGLGVLNFSQENLFKPNMTFSLTATYRLTTEDLRFGGQQRYKFGNEWQLYFGLGDQYVVGSRLVTPQLMFRYRHTAIDQTDGINTPNTGGHWLYVVPGVQLALSPAWGLAFTAELPVYRHLKGTQLTTSYRINASIIRNLKLK